MIHNPSIAVYLIAALTLCATENRQPTSLDSLEALGKESNTSEGTSHVGDVFLTAPAPPSLATRGGNDSKRDSNEKPQALSDDAMSLMAHDLPAEMKALEKDREALAKEKKDLADRKSKLQSSRTEFDSKREEDEKVLAEEAKETKKERESLEERESVLEKNRTDFQKGEEQWKKDNKAIEDEEVALSEEEKMLERETAELNKLKRELDDSKKELEKMKENLKKEKLKNEEYEKELQKPHGTCIEVPPALKKYLLDIGIYNDNVRFCYKESS